MAVATLTLFCLTVLVNGSTAADWRMNRVLLGSRLYDVAFLENGVRIATADGVVTLNAEGKELARHGYDTGISYAILAENGRYGVVRHRPRVPQFPEAITLFDDGETVAEFPITGMPYLSPNGDWLITTNRYTKTVAIFDSQGRLLREDTYSQVQGASISFSDNNQKVLINLPKGSTAGTTALYARDGRRLFKLDNGLGNANAVLSADGKRAAVIGRAEAAIYDETGTIWRTYPRGNRSGLGMMTRDGRELWLTEGTEIRIITVDTGDSRAIALDAEKGTVVKLVDEPSGRSILVGQKIERRESDAVWTWRVLDWGPGLEIWQGEERQPISYAAFGYNLVLKGTDEIELWIREIRSQRSE